MNLEEIKELKKREQKLLKKLTKLQKVEKGEVLELKDEVKSIQKELEEINKKINLLEPSKRKEIKKLNPIIDYSKKFWAFLKKDTWSSWFVSLILIIVLIKFIFFPLLSLATGSPLPLVVVESCSMYHETNFESWWNQNAIFYESKEIAKEDFENFPFKKGLNKGDILLVIAKDKYNIGEIIIFNPENSGLKNPLIHRIVTKNPISTKGDHNAGQLEIERNIMPDRIIGSTSTLRIPFAGWAKLIFIEPFREKSERGFCK